MLMQWAIKAFLVVLAIVIFSLSIVGIVHAQLPLTSDLFITILVFTIVGIILAAISLLLKKRAQKSEYDVNQGKKKSSKMKGKDNAAFNAAEEGRAGTKATSKSDKWVSNYVPHGDYPSGKQSSDSSSSSDDDVKKSQNGEAKWKKNYVAHQEELEEDSNKIQEDKS